jgi:hypothetical protein
MTTQQEYYDQCMAENPTQTVTINGVETVLTYEECCESCNSWALMKVEQDQALTPEA